MFDQLKKMFSGKSDDTMVALIKQGAVIVDVRSREEFASGHVRGSINIPLQELSKNLGKLKKDKPVIVCCASGARSASAKSLLESHQFTVHNAGGWRNVERLNAN